MTWLVPTARVKGALTASTRSCAGTAPLTRVVALGEVIRDGACPGPRWNVMCRHVPAPFWRPARPARTCFEVSAVPSGGRWPFLSGNGRSARMPRPPRSDAGGGLGRGGQRGASVCRCRMGTNGQRPPEGAALMKKRNSEHAYRYCQLWPVPRYCSTEIGETPGSIRSV